MRAFRGVDAVPPPLEARGLVGLGRPLGIATEVIEGVVVGVAEPFDRGGTGCGLGAPEESAEDALGGGVVYGAGFVLSADEGDDGLRVEVGSGGFGVCSERWGGGGGEEVGAVGIVEEGERGQSGVELGGRPGFGGRALEDGCSCRGHDFFAALVGGVWYCRVRFGGGSRGRVRLYIRQDLHIGLPPLDRSQ